MDPDINASVIICKKKSRGEDKSILLGEGSYGRVYKGQYSTDGQIFDCAVKEMSLRSVVSGFGNMNEIENLVKLQSCKFFPKLYTISLSKYIFTDSSARIPRNEYISIVTELAISDCSKYFKEGNYSFEDAKNIFSQILLGIDHMHKKGIAHRDLKPSNILYCRDNEGNILIKISDLGLATCLSSQGSHNVFVQTPWYKAPEIAHKVQKYKLSLDIWSVGVIFYEVICGPYMFSEIGQSEVSSDLEITNYLEFCISNIADDFTEELQEIYRQFSGYKPTIFGSQKIRKFERKTRSYSGKFSRKNRFKHKPSIAELTECSDFISKMLTFDYRRRQSASSLLRDDFLNSQRSYINMAKLEQYSEDVYDSISFSIIPEINTIKLDFFIQALRTLSFIPIRQMFYAVDIANRFFTHYNENRNDEIRDNCASILYTVHKYFSSTQDPERPEKFFFHKFPRGEITESEFQELDLFIYNFEMVYLEKDENNILKFFPLIRRCIYDMQTKYKYGITQEEKHSLTKEQLCVFFEEFCKMAEWNENRSYRYLYRFFYNKFIDPNFQV